MKSRLIAILLTAASLAAEPLRVSGSTTVNPVVAEAAGETAPILFTAVIFSGATVPRGVVDQPVLALPYHIFVLAQDSFHDASRANLWGAALVLVALVTALGLLALPLRRRLHHAADHA